MNQSVIAFSNATARSSAITSPVEGMITYLEDSNSYQSYDGSAWVGLVPQSPNAIINGAFEINQRNFTSSTVNAAYGFDRFRVFNADGTVTYSAQAFSLGAAPLAGYEASNFARIVTSGQTATSANARLVQEIESVRTFAGQTVTVSFFAKAASGSPKVSVEFGQDFGSGGSPSAGVNTNAGQVTLSTSWARYSLPVFIPSISGKTLGTNANSNFLRLAFWTSAGSDFNARTGSIGIQSNTIDFWGIQVEAGPVATPFRRNANSLQGELAACQRYYQRTALAQFSSLANGRADSATSIQMYINQMVPFRIGPTSVEFGGNISVSGVGTFVSAISIGVASPTQTRLNGTSAGLTTGNALYIFANSADAFLALSAEL
jgi:hypothetical protein